MFQAPGTNAKLPVYKYATPSENNPTLHTHSFTSIMGHPRLEYDVGGIYYSPRSAGEN
jgi:hypothetical protein